MSLLNGYGVDSPTEGLELENLSDTSEYEADLFGSSSSASTLRQVQFERNVQVGQLVDEAIGVAVSLPTMYNDSESDSKSMVCVNPQTVENRIFDQKNDSVVDNDPILNTQHGESKIETAVEEPLTYSTTISIPDNIQINAEPSQNRETTMLVDLSTLEGDAFDLVRGPDGNFVITPKKKKKDVLTWSLDIDNTNEATQALTTSYAKFSEDVSKYIKKLPKSFFDKSSRKRNFFEVCQRTIKDQKLKNSVKTKKFLYYSNASEEDSDED